MPRAPKPKPIVGEAGPELVDVPAGAEIVPAAETVDVGPVEEVVDGTTIPSLNLAATAPAPPAPVALVADEEPARELGKFDGYPVGVFVGLGVSETVIGDLGAFTVDPDTGLVTGPA